jgi:hypothetical protein
MTAALRRKQQPILSCYQELVEMQPRGRLPNDRSAKPSGPADEKRPPTGEESIQGAKLRSPLAASIQNQQLMPNQHRFRKNGAESTGLLRAGPS